MNADQFRVALADVGLNQTEAATFLGVGPRTLRRYIAGDAPVPQTTAMLLLVMKERRIRPSAVSAIAGRQPQDATS